MNYAFWRKCDFQVHSPRDPNWQGMRPVGEGDPVPTTGKAATIADVDAERARWASEFVDACVNRDLKAVALSDHHEMIMIQYVREEISRREENDPEFDLWLFPGMELTTRGGRQCLILFDASISDQLCRAVRGKLGITDANLNMRDAKGPAVTQIACAYPDLATEIETLNGISGKYIILPNVSQGGSNTVLRHGDHADFRRSPYVGGYLDQDQSIETLKRRNRTRLSGTDPKWSAREIYPLPTSDSRTANFSTLGTNETWIKLAEPTAEAIRQAFLGHKSRIRIGSPEIPTLAVAQVRINGSTILQSTSLSVSREFNSIIGGRGSGKSSFLEYLSFGLGRSCYDSEREGYSGSARLQDLVNDTLISNNGEVKLTLIVDNAEFKIIRSPDTAHQPAVAYPKGRVEIVTAKELRSLFPAVVYGQGELAEIGKQTGRKTQLSDLLRFVNPDYKNEDDRLLSDIGVAKENVRKAVQICASTWGLLARRRATVAQRESLQLRVQALRNTLPELSPEDQAAIASFDDANAFEAQRIQASKHADNILQELRAGISELLSKRGLEAARGGEAEAVRQRYDDLFNAFNRGIRALEVDIVMRRQSLSDAEKRWETSFLNVREDRDRVLEKLSAHSTATNQIKKLGEQISDLSNQLGDLDAALKAAGDSDAQLTAAVTALRLATDRRRERTEKWAGEIAMLSSSKIKASVDADGDISEIKEAIEIVAGKTGSHEGTRVKELESKLEGGVVWDVLNGLRKDCLELLRWRYMGDAAGDQKPEAAQLFGVVGDTKRIRVALAEKLDVLRVEAIATAVPKPEISLTYCDGVREISFEKASEGQRAAALLFMLLEQPGGPLIIDQPEGDLDNRIITELTDVLHSAKQKRQLIFASHNANIVVNGSSELVGYLDVDAAGSRNIECAGAIDKPEICEKITLTMEGGEKAFRDRQDKYGY